MSAENAAVFVVDDDDSVREALSNLLRSVGLNVWTFAAAQDFLSFPRPEVPCCLVLDVRLPGLSGLELQAKLAEVNIRIPIVFVTGHGDIKMSVRAMKAGAVEFLTKPFPDQDLLDAVQHAIGLDREALHARQEMAELRGRYGSLSHRQQEVMRLVVRGLLNKQIASELGTSDATVKLHRGQLMHKMRAASVAELVRMADRLRLSGTGPEDRGDQPAVNYTKV